MLAGWPMLADTPGRQPASESAGKSGSALGASTFARGRNWGRQRAALRPLARPHAACAHQQERASTRVASFGGLSEVKRALDC